VRVTAGSRPFVAIALLTTLHIVVPGHPDLPLHGIPLGPIATVTLAAVVVVAIGLRGARIGTALFRVATVAIVTAIVLRVAIAGIAWPSGWTARYYAQEQAGGAPEWSSDFHRLDATRIDPRIDFRDNTFPAHYLNDYAFERGDRREVTEPMRVDWTGRAFLPSARDVHVSLAARGKASIDVDGRLVRSVESTGEPAQASAAVPLRSGAHALAVHYLKPANTDGLIAATIDVTVVPERSSSNPRRWWLVAALAIDLFVVAIFIVTTVAAARDAAATGALTMSRMVVLALGTFFGAQGAWQASRFAGRVTPLTAGDDWFGFESSAREILRHGLLMPMGRPIGEGTPFFYHPFYCYFLAAVHRITGETLFGPVFVQFLMLAAVGWLVWRLVAEWFGAIPAAAALVALVAIFELDFARYYTIALLSENLYILTVTLTLTRFVAWMRGGDARDLMWTGVWAGVSTITRPPMLLFFIPALAIVALRSRSVSRVALLGAVWLAVVSPITIRNLVVSHRFVLVSDVPVVSVFTYNIPPSVSAAEYGAKFRGTGASVLQMLALMTWEHPAAMLGVQVRKVGFSLGMIHWGPGYRPHPELMAISALYLGALVFSRRMRQRAFWPIHAFVACHLASMTITMPWNYGYRLILPPFVYTTALSIAVASAAVGPRRSAPVPMAESPV
jgi:dolichyl-phosphate-mannose-protein mannosyltransferase